MGHDRRHPDQLPRAGGRRPHPRQHTSAIDDEALGNLSPRLAASMKQLHRHSLRLLEKVDGGSLADDRRLSVGGGLSRRAYGLAGIAAAGVSGARCVSVQRARRSVASAEDPHEQHG